MRHIALEGRCFVIGVNPVLRIDQIPLDFPRRDQLWPNDDHDGWVESGNSVIVDPTGKIIAGPARREEIILYADIDLAEVHAARRFFDPVGHQSRPDIFRLQVDTRSRSSVIISTDPVEDLAENRERS